MTLSGDWGSLKFNGSGSSSALGAVDDVMPNAYEESWDILDTDGTNTTGSPLTIGGGGGTNMFIYTFQVLQEQSTMACKMMVVQLLLQIHTLTLL